VHWCFVSYGALSRGAIALLSFVLAACGPAERAAKSMARGAAPEAVTRTLTELAKPESQRLAAEAFATPASERIVRRMADGLCAALLDDAELAQPARIRQLATQIVLGIDDALSDIRTRDPQRSGLLPVAGKTEEVAEQGLRLGWTMVAGVAALLVASGIASALLIRRLRGWSRGSSSKGRAPDEPSL
jgi:hypothetical protein